MAKISLIIPFHWMINWPFFLHRCLGSVERQTFTDYEIILTHSGLMAANSNRAIQSAKGEIIKILYLDDYFAHPNALQVIADNFKGGWLVTGCEHDNGEQRFNPHFPSWNEKFAEGINTIGSPSVLAFENKNPELFDEKLSWMLDVELYLRLFERYGSPTYVNDVNVVIGCGEHQTTYVLSPEEKQKEVEYVVKKYA